jgi:putative spermidine/putrescine transport system permease protein
VTVTDVVIAFPIAFYMAKVASARTRNPLVVAVLIPLWSSYLWLPYMIIPHYAGLERIPDSLLDASGDLGGKPGTAARRVILPLALPAMVAGSIFTFSLTLGDYITPGIVSSTQFIGNVVYSNVGVANNLPLAVTTFTAGGQQTLPLWILTNLSRPNQLPIVNVVGVLVILLSAIPLYFAHHLTQDEVTSAAPAA